MTRSLLLIALACTATLRADDAPLGPDGKPRFGHSAHGEAFDEGPRQAATLLPSMGNVHFAVTTKSEEAAKFFDQGVAQLHGFWYYEAERSFRQVAAIDPDCAMAYWGMSMANVNNEKRARAFIKKATPLKSKATPREQKWITVLENLYRDDDKRDKKQKSLDCLKDFPENEATRALHDLCKYSLSRQT